MIRPWSAYLRNATDKILPMPVSLRAQLLRLLVPELADLRQQLDQARRLAGEAQARYREAELDLKIAAEARDHYQRRATEVTTERDQLRARVAELEAERARVEWCIPQAASKDDERIQVHACPVCGGVKPSSVAERVCPSDIGHKSSCTYGPKGGAPEFTADGQPITYVDADEQPTHRHFPKPGGFYP